MTTLTLDHTPAIHEPQDSTLHETILSTLRSQWETCPLALTLAAAEARERELSA